VSLRHDQRIPVNKAANEKEQLEKGLEEEEEVEKKFLPGPLFKKNCPRLLTTLSIWIFRAWNRLFLTSA
jgi:hypothetical protein